MRRLLLDSGVVEFPARRDRRSLAVFNGLRNSEFWPPVVHTVVLAECLTGRQRHDAVVNRFIKTCQIVDRLPERTARRAGELRTLAGRGSAVDAVLVAAAEPDGIVLTEDVKDMRALAARARGVAVRSTTYPGTR